MISVDENIFWHRTGISRIRREFLKGHKGFVLWFTGLSGSGKSTVANVLEEKLYALGCHTYLLDGDNIRKGLNSDLGFSADDRSENIRRVSEVAKLFVDCGIIVIAAFISPYKSDRICARNKFEKDDFIEIYADCDISVCEARDVKGLYGKARKGIIKNFTGISDPYEKPENPEITIKTDMEDAEKCAGRILEYLKENYGI